MRSLKQPGEAVEPRRVFRAVDEAGQFRVVVPPDEDLLQGLTGFLVHRAIERAAIQLVAGSFAHLEYLTGQPDWSGERVATYGAPTLLDGPVELVGGNAMLGLSEDGGPLLHCHAVFVDREGRLHGHLPPGVCIAGAEGITTRVTALAGAGFRAAYDAETNYSIFQPEETRS